MICDCILSKLFYTLSSFICFLSLSVSGFLFLLCLFFKTDNGKRGLDRARYSKITWEGEVSHRRCRSSRISRYYGGTCTGTGWQEVRPSSVFVFITLFTKKTYRRDKIPLSIQPHSESPSFINPFYLSIRVVSILTGNNIGTTLLSHCLDRGLAAERRLVKFQVTLSKQPGTFTKLCNLVSSLGVSIKDILQEREWNNSDVFRVQVSFFFYKIFIGYNIHKLCVT